MGDLQAAPVDQLRPAPPPAEPGTGDVTAVEVPGDTSAPTTSVPAGGASLAPATEPSSDADPELLNDTASVGVPSVFSTGLSVRRRLSCQQAYNRRADDASRSTTTATRIRR